MLLSRFDLVFYQSTAISLDILKVTEKGCVTFVKVRWRMNFTLSVCVRYIRDSGQNILIPTCARKILSYDCFVAFQKKNAGSMLHLLFMLSRKDVHSLRLLCRSYSPPVLAVFHSALLPLPEEPRVLAIYREPHFLQTSEKLNFVAMPRKAPFLSNTQKSLVSS